MAHLLLLPPLPIGAATLLRDPVMRPADDEAAVPLPAPCSRTGGEDAAAILIISPSVGIFLVASALQAFNYR